MSLSRPRPSLPQNNEASWVVCLLRSPRSSSETDSPAGDSSNTSETAPVDQERGQKTADNIRYGQNVSESGMGGQTTSGLGSAGQQGGFGGAPDQSESPDDTRTQQRHGEGSGVGA